MLILGIDIGTSSVRSALFSDGRRLLETTAQGANRLITDPQGRAELDPLRLERAIAGCIDRTLAAATSRRASAAIIGVGMSCFWHSLLGCDRQGAPLTAVVTWADSRASGDAERLRQRHDEAEVHRASGCMLRASFWPAKLAWLRRTDAGLMRKVWRWMSPAEWLQWRWCGEARAAHGMATATGLYDPGTCGWSAELLRRFAVESSQLNPIGDEPLTLAGRWAHRWPRLADAQWQPAIGDGAASNLGAGAVAPGLAAINVGTSAAVRVVRTSGKPVAPLGMFCYRIDRARYLIGGAVSNAGSLVSWCQRTLRLPPASQLEAALAADAPGTLAVLPFWLAERSPSWRDDLSGVILGLRQSTTPTELVLAITGAGYLRLAAVLTALPGGGSARLRLGGGILQSPASVQRLSDCLGRALELTDEPELSLRGAVVLALERAGVTPLPPRRVRTVEPRQDRHRRWAREGRRLVELERQLFGAAPSTRSPGVRT